ncbi:MAG: hypothetical protein QGI78_00965 [Phycisphaerales bacterium]|jgi:opacity protein-like surface antigen|nr:hypothetical protein [Phycisphaerales bacterium]
MTPTLLTIVLAFQGTNLDIDAATVRGGAWFPRLGGTITDGGVIDLETTIDLRTRENVALIEFELRPIEHLTFSLTAFDFSTSGTGVFSGSETFGGVVFNSGDLWSADTSMRTVAAEVSWDYWRPYPRGGDTMLTFSPIVGAQWYGTSFDIQNDTSALSVHQDHSWLALYGGLRFDLGWDTREQIQWIDSLSIGAECTAGALVGNDGGSLWAVKAGVSLEFTDGVSGYFGYRLREMNAEDGNYVFDAGLQGIYVGVQWRF